MAESVDFNTGDFVKIDGRGKAEILEKVYRGFGTFYHVRVCDSDFECEIESHRLSRFPEASIPNPQQVDEPNQFPPMPNEAEIDQFINEQSNRSTLAKTVYDLNILRQFLSSPEINETRNSTHPCSRTPESNVYVLYDCYKG